MGSAHDDGLWYAQRERERIRESDKMTEDEQEALSIKYRSPRVAALSSGRFAIFDVWSQAEGLPLLSIVEAENLPAALRAFKSRPSTLPSAPVDEIDIDSLFTQEPHP